MKICAPVLKWRCLGVLICTNKMLISCLTFPAVQTTSCGPQSFLRQASGLAKATEPSRRGIAHCGLCKPVRLAIAPHYSEILLHPGRESAALLAVGSLTVSEKPWELLPRQDTDCLRVWGRGTALIQHETGGNSIKQSIWQELSSDCNGSVQWWTLCPRVCHQNGRKCWIRELSKYLWCNCDTE